MTIFVIIALIVVVSIALVFVLVRKTIYPSVGVTPEADIQKCLSDSLMKAEAKLIEGSFYANMTDNYEIYQSKKAKYLCKTSQFYVPCVNQEPALIEKLRRDIQNLTKTDVERCIESMKSAFEREGYDVAVNETGMPAEVSFEGSDIIATVNEGVTLKKNEEVRNFQKFSGKISSPIFALAKTAITIVNFESALCEFNPSGWMGAYPNIEIRRFVTSDGAKIYTLTDIESEKSVLFAVKSCVLPAGI